jgi:LysR family nitrogen assimilation transcriptional regulator
MHNFDAFRCIFVIERSKPLDLKLLRSFVVVAEAQNFTKAALTLSLTQPALTRQIQRLESDLGVSLFRRARRQTQLTEHGAILLEQARTIFAAVEQAEAMLQAGAPGPTGGLALGISPAAGQMLIPLLLERAARLFPKVKIHVVEGFTAHIHEGLLEARLDLGVLHDPEDRKRLHVVPLLREPLLLVGPRGSAPVRRQRASERDLSAIAKLPLILPSRPNGLRLHIEQIAADNGTTLNIRAEVDSIGITKALVQRGFGYTILSYELLHQEIARGEVEVIPIRHLKFERRVVIARAMAKAETGLQQAVTALIRDLARELVERRQWPGAKLAV